MFKMKDMLVSHIKPYKYREDNKCVGNYVVNMSNVQFIPNADTTIVDAVKTSINISNKYKMPTWMDFDNIRVNITYPASDDCATIQNIVNTFFDRLEIARYKNRRCR